MHSADNLSAARWDKTADNGVLSPPFESKTSPTSDWPMQNNQANNRTAPPNMVADPKDESKWIHRDKLAKIESQELQAAGIFVPRSRAPSKQRRDRSHSRLRRGTDSSEQSHHRSRKDSATAEQRALEESDAPFWDLRTPEEIAEEEANAYFTSSGLTGGSRIPVAKTSPAPIPLDYLERGSTTARKLPESPEDGNILYNHKTRSRSASTADQSSYGGLPAGKRSATDASPKKGTPAGRKSSAPAKTPPTATRPKTRSGSNSGTRPSTRSGEQSAIKSPEGDPPWMVNNYRPDPRLPPDQQLLPTVARRLQQEKWEKEGKFGDVYDKDFRPLNDNVHLKPPEAEKSPTDEEHHQLDEWPLRPEAKSPRQGSYSTMPKISDKQPSSPMTPRPPPTPQPFDHPQSPPQSQFPERFQEEPNEPEKKRGCGCCVVM